MIGEIRKQSRKVAEEIIEISKIEEGDILVVGCSSSEISGGIIGKNSNLEIAQAVFEEIYSLTKEKGIYLACQCCEHLNRAIIVEKELAKRDKLEIVNVVPQIKAGGSFATMAQKKFVCPVAVENIEADAGIDIGGTLIGMHLKNVAVPVRLSVSKIGQANIICARTRPKYIGGSRAVYEEE